MIWPFMSLVLCLFKKDKTYFPNLLWMFFMYYGMTFALSIESLDNDIVRYQEMLLNIRADKLSFTNILSEHLLSGEFDLYSITVAYIASLFSSSINVLTFLFSIIFGYFLTRNIYLIQTKSDLKNPFILVLIVLFFFLNPIHNINGARFYTALQIFVYGILYFIHTKKKKYLLFCLLTPIIHFSYYLPIIILIFSSLLRKFPKIIFYFFVVSIVSSELLTNEIISNFVSKIGVSVFEERTIGYTDKELIDLYLEDNSTNLNWYIKYLNYFLKIGLNILVISVYFLRIKTILKNDFDKQFFSISLFVFSLGNFLSNHFVIGRFYSLGALLIVSFMIYFLSKSENKYFMYRIGFLRHIVMTCLLIFSIVGIRTWLFSMSLSTIFLNPIFSIFIENHVSINDLLRGFI